VLIVSYFLLNMRTQP